MEFCLSLMVLVACEQRDHSHTVVDWLPWLLGPRGSSLTNRTGRSRLCQENRPTFKRPGLCSSVEVLLGSDPSRDGPVLKNHMVLMNSWSGFVQKPQRFFGI